MDSLKAEVGALVYVFPSVDFLERGEFTMSKPRETGTAHRLLERTQAALIRAAVTRTENLLMIAISKNDTKTKKRVGEVTAELTSKAKKPWFELIDGRVKVLADAVLAQGDPPGAAASPLSASTTPSTRSAGSVKDPPTKRSKKSKQK